MENTERKLNPVELCTKIDQAWEAAYLNGEHIRMSKISDIVHSVGELANIRGVEKRKGIVRYLRALGKDQRVSLSIWEELHDLPSVDSIFRIFDIVDNIDQAPLSNLEKIEKSLNDKISFRKSAEKAIPLLGLNNSIAINKALKTHQEQIDLLREKIEKEKDQINQAAVSTKPEGGTELEEDSEEFSVPSLTPISSSESINNLTIERKVSAEALAQSREYAQKNRISGNLLDGFKDGGRYVQFDEEGNVIDPKREVIVVDRSRDHKLSELIKEALKKIRRAPRAAILTQIYELANLIHEQMHYPQYVDNINNFVGQEVLVGDISGENNLAGVCRHSSLEFQIMASELGFDVTLVRGYVIYDGETQPTPHAWSEIDVYGKTWAVDITLPREVQHRE